MRECDQLSLILMAVIALLGGGTVLLCCWRRFEVAIGLILLSPWVNWLLYSNVARSTEEEGAVGAASYVRILLVLLVGCCGTLQILRSWFSGQTKSIPNYLLCFGFFVLYAVFSTSYSIDHKFTLIRSSEFLIFYMFLLGLHYWLTNRRKLNNVLNIYFLFVVVGIVLNVVALILIPHRVWAWRMPDRFQGLLDHPNMFGALCLLSYPILAWKFSTSKGGTKFAVAILVCITAGLHIMSGSRASMLASVIGCVAWGVLTINKITLKHIAVSLTVILILTLGVCFLLFIKPASLTRRGEAITTLTGRSEFWKGCLLLIKEQPVQGYGYGVAGKVWEDPRFYREGEFLWVGSAKSSLHNGYLSLTIGLGIVGLGLWMGFVAVPIWRLLSLRANPYKALILTIVIELLVLNIFESALSSGSQIYTSLMFWFILIIAGRMPDLLTVQSRLTTKTYKDAKIGFIDPTTNIPSGLCSGYTGT